MNGFSYHHNIDLLLMWLLQINLLRGTWFIGYKLLSNLNIIYQGGSLIVPRSKDRQRDCRTEVEVM